MNTETRTTARQVFIDTVGNLLTASEALPPEVRIKGEIRGLSKSELVDLGQYIARDLDAPTREDPYYRIRYELARIKIDIYSAPLFCKTEFFES